MNLIVKALLKQWLTQEAPNSLWERSLSIFAITLFIDSRHLIRVSCSCPGALCPFRYIIVQGCELRTQRA